MADKLEPHEITITTPLGARLLFSSMVAVEELGRAFKYDIELLSDDHTIKMADLLGCAVTVEVRLGANSKRPFHGFVTRFAYVGSKGRRARYTASVRPWLWFLTRSADCRIFQEMSVPDIVRKVCKDHGFTDVDESLNHEYGKRDFCVQYRETAFNFVTRLLEEEGIYFTFRHETGKHTLVLCDSPASHEAVAGYETVRYVAPADGETRQPEVVSDWQVAQEVQTGTCSLTDYDFERPRTNLRVAATIGRTHPESEREVFDYPGEYRELERGQQLARSRVEELHAQYELAEGEADARGLATGAVFTLASYPRPDQNRAYLITSCTYELRNPDYESGQTAADVDVFRCRFTTLDAQLPYRAPRVTPKPVVQGPQTAVVVGPEGERIWTDKYGRVKVQFHWDREGKGDETSSCWMRVSQSWAGSGWGAMFLPHIGQEVIVEFLEGDPDRPIVTGRVYNAEQMPPLTLPDNKHKSIIRDDFGNEIVFDATPGDEHLALHAPNHETTMVLGRSLKYATDSDRNSWTFGESTSGVLGATAELKMGIFGSAVLGISAELFGGGKLSVFLGSGFDVALGWKTSIACAGALTFNWGFNYTRNEATQVEEGEESYYKLAEEDIKLDAGKNAYIVGGKNDASVLSLKQDFAYLTFKKVPAPVATGAQSRKAQMLKAAVLGNVGAWAAGLTAMSTAFLARTGTAMGDDKGDSVATATTALTDADNDRKAKSAAVETALAERNAKKAALDSAKAEEDQARRHYNRMAAPDQASQEYIDWQASVVRAEQAQTDYDAAVTDHEAKKHAYSQAEIAYQKAAADKQTADAANTAEDAVDEDWQLGTSIAGVAVTGGIAVGAMIWSYQTAKAIAKSAQVAPPSQVDPNTGVKLEENELTLTAGTTILKLTKDGDVEITAAASNNIKLTAGGNVDLAVGAAKALTIKVGGANALSVKTKEITAHKGVKHNNLLVLE